MLFNFERLISRHTVSFLFCSFVFQACLGQVDLSNLHQEVIENDQLRAHKDTFCKSKYTSVAPFYYQNTGTENLIVRTENDVYRVDLMTRKFLGKHSYADFPEGVAVLCSLKVDDTFHLVLSYGMEVWVYLYQGSNRYARKKVNGLGMLEEDIAVFTGCTDCDHLVTEGATIRSFQMTGIMRKQLIQAKVVYNGFDFDAFDVERFGETPIPTLSFLCRAFAYMPKDEILVMLDNHQNFYITYEKVWSVRPSVD